MLAYKKIIIGAALLLIAVFLFKKGGKESPPAKAKPALTVSLVHPEMRALPKKIISTGTVQAWQEAVIGSEVNGLRLSEVNVNVGDSVKKGQVLARFSDEMVHSELEQQRAALDEARAKLAEAELNAAGAQKLSGSGSMSAQEIQKYLTAAQAAQAQARLASAKLAAQELVLRYTKVVAIDDGLISSRTATVGAVMQSGGELFRLIRKGRLEWRAELPQAQLRDIRIGQKVSLNFDKPVMGKVSRISPVVNAQTRNGAAYVELPQNPSIKAGMFAQGDFDLGISSALTLPQSAVVVRDGYSYVYKLGKDNRISQIKVTAGRRMNDRIEIEGLDAAASVVSSGAGFLSDGDLVSVVSDAR